MKRNVKAIFIDHMGTIVAEDGKYAKKVILRTYENSRASSLKEVAEFWFRTNDKLMEKAYGDKFKTVYDISLETFEITDKKFHIRDNIDELCKILEMNWIYAPAFQDTKEFFEKCPLPIYILSNNDDKYITEAIKNIGINPTGTITSEMARAYKPRKEIFELALRKSGCQPDEVIHIGDSIQNDVMGARAVGIEPWLLDRSGENKDKDIISFSSLEEVLDEIG